MELVRIASGGAGQDRDFTGASGIVSVKVCPAVETS